jgi:hypothetical protein
MTPIKTMAYAEDIAVILGDPSEWSRLQILLDIYCSASNAKLNIEKTEVVFLLKSPAVDWRRLCQQKGMRWHDSSTDDVPVYLGYPLCRSRRQWIRYLDLLLDKIDRHLKILRQNR